MGRQQPMANGAFDGSSWECSGQPVLQQHAQVVPMVARPVHFCPHCGTKVELTHRFCPFCCCQLQTGGAAPRDDGGCAMPTPALARQAAVASVTPELISNLKRFRYVEASASDI